MHLYLTIAIIGIGIFLFVKDYFTIDTTSIIIMALFIVSGVLNPEEGFSGFNHPATITLGCMFVVSSALFKSGFIDGLSIKLLRIVKTRYLLALAVFCVTSAVLSAFINDSAVVALLIPLALEVCRETNIHPSRLLMPISFSALFGGTCTLIGTSTNLLVSGYAEKNGLEPFGMFEFTLPALCLLLIGLLYIFIIGPLLLPKRASAGGESLTKEAEKYITEIQIKPRSKDINKEILQSKIVTEFFVQIISLSRDGKKFQSIHNNMVLKENDVLKVLINPDKLTHLQEVNEYRILGYKENILTKEEGRKVYETMIPEGSRLAGKSLKKINFRNIYHASVLAIRHRNETITENLSDVSLKEGDMMLIFGHKEGVDRLVANELVILLSEYKEKRVNYKKAIPALIIAIGVVAAAAFNLTSILVSGMVGCILLITTSVLKPEEAYEAIDWKVIFMMAGVLSMGTALEKTGGALLASEFISETLGSVGPRMTLSLIFLMTFLSTNAISSKATAALMTPIVINLASNMQVSERPFLIGVMFACSLTFMTPVSYPTNTMVYSPGNYRFKDFLKIGTPLNLIIWIAASLIIPLFFPF